MRYYHSIFKQLHFDYGKMIWSVNHVPFFGAVMSVCDHRNVGSLHSIEFFALLKVLSNGKIRKKQADAIFSLVDLSANGEMSFSEIAFWAGIVVAQKDHLEREFLYMHAWKIWVTFNETGSERVTTKEFRKAGLFFDFDYPTIYHMYRDYNWDEEKPMEFERFRFYLMSCIHFRSLRRATAKYLRYKKFKTELLHVLQPTLRRVLRYNVYPPPRTILKAIKLIKMPPIDGQEQVYHWSDVFSMNWARNFVSRQVQIFKLQLLKIMDTSKVWQYLCKIFCCGLCCIGMDDDNCECVERWVTIICRWFWNMLCLFCCCFGCCGCCLIKKRVANADAKPLKPVIIRRDVELEMIEEIEKNRHLFRPKHVVYDNPTEGWRHFKPENRICAIQ